MKEFYEYRNREFDRGVRLSRARGHFSFWDRFLGGCILLTFIVQVIFPPRVFAQVTAVIPRVVPAYAPVMSGTPLVIPYAALSRPSEQRDGASSGAYAYDGLNRVASETTTYPFGGRTISYTYDRFGNRQTAVYPGGMGTIAYGYDEFNRLTSMSYGASTVTYSYDPAGRLTSKTLPNGVAASYTYDNANRLTSLTNRRTDSSVISSFSYTHDNVGNRLTMTEVPGPHSYSYDDIYRLLGASHPSAPTESYTYDRVGNRLTSAAEPSWNYDQNNRLLSYDGVAYNYDDNGNRASRTAASSLTSYSYDFENRLETANPGVPVSYSYDPFGRRLSKTVGGVTTYYLYDEEDVIAEYDSTGALIHWDFWVGLPGTCNVTRIKR